MKKIILTIFLLLGIWSMSQAQFAVIYNDTLVNVSWSHSGSDILEQLEDSVYFKVQMCNKEDSTIIVEALTPDTTYIFDLSEYVLGNFIFNVSAIDGAGNESEKCWSHNQGSQSWFIRIDTIPPKAPENLRIIK